jgi:DNA repair exonuclease SbcCD ATPase subunit
MSVIIKDLTIKNFLSIGNTTQAISLNQNGLVLVRGENLDATSEASGIGGNGSGKTTIGNALSYALFGQALSNIKKDNLVNKINGRNMLVTLTFEKDNIQYRIERGRKPSILKFYVNNVERSLKETDDAQGDSRETQKDLTEILGLTYDMYKHIVSLNTYTEPFLALKPSEQRPVIEQLLGITQLSEKATLLSSQIKQTKDQIFQETANIDAIVRSNEKIQQTIDALGLRQTAWYNQKNDTIEKIATAIVELESVDIAAELQLHAQLKVYTEQRAKFASLNKERATLEAAIMQAQKTVNKCKTELDSLDEKRCHACHQELQDHKHAELSLKAIEQIKDAENYYNEVSAALEIITAELSLIEVGTQPNTYYATIDEAYKHQNNLEALLFQLEQKSNETDPYQNQIDEMKHVALQEVSWDTVNELTVLKEHQDFLYKLLTNKDSFIRRTIIDQNLLYLNNRLSFYLNKMGLPHIVVFQNDLSVEITQMGQSLDFHNLSRGEMNRLILSLSWSFRDVWENLVHGINILFIDELIDNGLDTSGVENALSVLKSISRDRDKNVFLISHKEELVGRVSNILKVVKENHFTSFEDIEVVE